MCSHMGYRSYQSRDGHTPVKSVTRLHSRCRDVLRNSLAAAAFVVGGAASAAAEPITIVALGDSLMAGYGLAEGEAFPAELEAALQERGYDVDIVNAGVSGDTATSGAARLDWAVGDEADGVIVELGANDMLRGVDPARTREAVESIVSRLTDRGLEVLLTGMLAAPNLGPDYAETFNSIFPEIAAEYDTLFYPFFLEGVAAEPALNQPDGIHPTAEGVEVIVERIMPKVVDLIEKIRAGE